MCLPDAVAAEGFGDGAEHMVSAAMIAAMVLMALGIGLLVLGALERLLLQLLWQQLPASGPSGATGDLAEGPLWYDLAEGGGFS